MEITFHVALPSDEYVEKGQSPTGDFGEAAPEATHESTSFFTSPLTASTRADDAVALTVTVGVRCSGASTLTDWTLGVSHWAVGAAFAPVTS